MCWASRAQRPSAVSASASQQRPPSEVSCGPSNDAARWEVGRRKSIDWDTRHLLGRRGLTLQPTPYRRLPRALSAPHEQKRLALAVADETVAPDGVEEVVVQRQGVEVVVHRRIQRDDRRVLHDHAVESGVEAEAPLLVLHDLEL